MWLVDLNYDFECDWLIELSGNRLSNSKLSDNNLANELVETRSFFEPILIEEIVIFMIKDVTKTWNECTAVTRLRFQNGGQGQFGEMWGSEMWVSNGYAPRWPVSSCKSRVRLVLDKQSMKWRLGRKSNRYYNMLPQSVSTKCRLQTADRVQNADEVQNADCRLQTFPVPLYQRS